VHDREVEDMARHAGSESELDPTWDEAVAEFESGEPAGLARSPRTLLIYYRYVDDRWQVSAPELEGFYVSAVSLPAARKLVSAELADYLDPLVKLDNA
jgi:hypothetical protein